VLGDDRGNADRALAENLIMDEILLQKRLERCLFGICWLFVVLEKNDC